MKSIDKAIKLMTEAENIFGTTERFEIVFGASTPTLYVMSGKNGQFLGELYMQRDDVVIKANGTKNTLTIVG
jgi:hypothetical protein